MGTRNLTAVMLGGQYVVAQYGQWDGYPDGQGKTALEFCRKHLRTAASRLKFIEKLGLVRFASEEEHKKLWESIGVTEEWVTFDKAEEFDKLYPYFSRDNGAKILEMIWKSKNEVLTQNSIDFAGDSLFCEWAYIIDLDKQTFEVYKGFNQSALTAEERFVDIRHDEKYQPIKHHTTWKFDKLPTVNKFLKHFEEKEDD